MAGYRGENSILHGAQDIAPAEAATSSSQLVLSEARGGLGTQLFSQHQPKYNEEVHKRQQQQQQPQQRQQLSQPQRSMYQQKQNQQQKQQQHQQQQNQKHQPEPQPSLHQQQHQQLLEHSQRSLTRRNYLTESLQKAFGSRSSACGSFSGSSATGTAASTAVDSISAVGTVGVNTCGGALPKCFASRQELLSELRLARPTWYSELSMDIRGLLDRPLSELWQLVQEAKTNPERLPSGLATRNSPNSLRSSAAILKQSSLHSPLGTTNEVPQNSTDKVNNLPFRLQPLIAISGAAPFSLNDCRSRFLHKEAQQQEESTEGRGSFPFAKQTHPQEYLQKRPAPAKIGRPPKRSRTLGFNVRHAAIVLDD
eukprot:TRINITY_DN20611_c1_g1_i1.p1 TRINITY_DN20611_c1_g1~~TRINITY_DN20611_c1_g1_i1.p1  ORF type:complete len:409 (-),score=91.95 TRINITY_DN20611_c1_g1_i1:402-1502(-)